MSHPGHSVDTTSSHVHDQLNQRSIDHHDKVFIHCIDQRADITFGRFDDLSHQIAWYLHRNGVGSHDRVSVLAENTIECALVYLAIQRHGAIVNPVNIRAHEENVAQILGDVDPLVVFHPATEQGLADRVRRSAPRARWVPYNRYDASEPEPGTLFFELAQEAQGPWPGPSGGPDTPALIVHTSGTGSKPKGVVHSRDSLRCATEACVELVAMTDADRILEFRDLSWISPQVLTIGSSAATGATALLAPSFSRSRFFEWLAALDVTVAVGVPTAINMLLADPVDRPEGTDLPFLRFMTSSTAPLSPEQHRAFEHHYGIEVQQFMGMSEAGLIAGNRPGKRKIGTVGPPALFQDLRVVDPGGRAVPTGVEGEIVVGGRQVALGYFVDGRLVPMDDRGALRTGDLGVLDPDMYLTVTGRLKELIIRGGVNISPLEVTRTLLSHPAVADAATVSIPSPIYGEEVGSVVVLKSDLSVDELLRHCGDHLAIWKVPSKIVAVEQLPRTDRQKVDNARVQSLLR